MYPRTEKGNSRGSTVMPHRIGRDVVLVWRRSCALYSFINPKQSVTGSEKRTVKCSILKLNSLMNEWVPATIDNILVVICNDVAERIRTESSLLEFAFIFLRVNIWDHRSTWTPKAMLLHQAPSSGNITDFILK